ncbi:MAG: Gldg family protein [Treponema sp.]|nr:Gldg family protein [Treponema sp.]
MKKNYPAVLKFHLSSYFNGPLFYIIAILFELFTAIYFFIMQKFFIGSGTTNLVSYFTAVPYVSILAIPALCYKRSQSVYYDFIPLEGIKKILLQFLSIFILYSILIVFLLPSCFLVNIFGSVDAGQIFTSVIMLLFYGASLISLCLFISSLLQSAISAFIVSSVILSIINSAHLVTSYVNINSFFAGIIKLLSFAWHFDAASKGIIDTRDIFYLSGFTVLFITLNDFVSLIRKGKIFTAKLKINYILQFMLILLITANGLRWYTRIDFSKNKTYSLSKYTRQLCSKIDEPLKITYYRSSALTKLYPTVRDIADFLVSYASQNKNISFLIKDPDSDVSIQNLLQNYGITTRQFRSIKNNSTEFINAYSAIVLEYEGRWETIPIILTADSLEYDLDGRAGYLISDKQRVVNIIIGNEMSLDEDYSYVIPWLNSQGFLCYPISVSDPYFENLLDNTEGPLMVIGDNSIRIEQAIAIEKYILCNRGNALFMISPYSADLQNSWNITENKNTDLIEIIENWGVQFTNKIAADISCARITMYSTDTGSSDYIQQNINFSQWVSILPQTNTNLGVTLFWPVQLNLQSENAVPYLKTTDYSWYYEADRKHPEKVIESNPFIIEQEDKSTKEKLSQTVAAKITGSLNGYYNELTSENSTVIIIPDQYFVNSLMNGYIGQDYEGDYRNFDFMTNVLLKLNGEEQLASLHSKKLSDTTLNKITDAHQFNSAKNLVFIILFAVIPLLICAIRLLFYILQKRKLSDVK